MSASGASEKMDTFSMVMDDYNIVGNIIVLKKCCFVWIGVGEKVPCFDNLITSIPCRFEQMPLSTNLLQPSSPVDSDMSLCNTISQKIAKKYQLQAFVSCSVPYSVSESCGKSIHGEIINRLSSILKL